MVQFFVDGAHPTYYLALAWYCYTDVHHCACAYKEIRYYRRYLALYALSWQCTRFSIHLPRQPIFLIRTYVATRKTHYARVIFAALQQVVRTVYIRWKNKKIKG